MDWQLTLSIITVTMAGIGSCAGAVASIIAAWHAWHNQLAIRQVHVELNSRLTELLALTAITSHAEGVAAEVARNKKEGT